MALLDKRRKDVLCLLLELRCLYDQRVSYDNAGNLVGKTNLVTGETWAYGHDHVNRLLSAKHRAADGTLLLRATYMISPAT